MGKDMEKKRLELLADLPAEILELAVFPHVRVQARPLR